MKLKEGMKISTDAKKIDEVLRRGVAEAIGGNHLRERLLRGEQLRVKLGIDPTSPDLHLGRSIPLLKLRDFQELGHQAVLIVGNFTGVIGDTSDKDAERPMLDAKVITENMKTYVEQAGKILDIDAAEICYNGDWLAKLTYAEIGSQADQFSLAEFIARENIARRLNNGKHVSLRELLYPLMQGYDSVAVKADVELGGTDQRFNLLAGRTLQQFYQQPPQDIVMTNLIPGLDGRKMSSSWGNTINLSDSGRDMFGKIMSMPDELIMTYFEHCTRVPSPVLHDLSVQASLDPMKVKKDLARAIVAMYYSEREGITQQTWFEETFSKKQAPEDMAVVEVVPAPCAAIDIVKKYFGDEKSNSELRRLFAQGGISLNGEKISAPDHRVTPTSDDIWHIGKRVWFKIKISK